MTITAVFPGSFDPITSGHMDVLTRASRMFDHVTMTVMHNARKQGKHLFTLEERLDILRQAAESLADLAGRIRQQAGLPAWPVIATGGALQSEPLAAMLREALPGVTIQFRAHEATASALALDLLP